MSKLQFRLAYRTDAAGKYNATAPLEGNEDNMFVDANLSSPEHGASMADDVVDLSEKGCLMVVADGMGGMNAGEVASDIAIKTVTEYFDAEHMAAKSFSDSRSRMKYMEDVVVAADAAIKADASVDKEHEGMGSTIIMAWLCDNEICLTWCGDSRAYLYRPGCGFWQVSKDHSYVQGLVDDGKITPDEAFDHPYGNIITRSLGDPEKKAKADSVNFEVYEGDIFMLCSDGLSGVLRDHKTYVDGQRIETENLEDIIAANRSSMAQCRDELFAAAERNDWYDNVTAILCEIVSGNPLPADQKAPVQAALQPSSASTEEPLNYTAAPNPVQPNNMHNGGSTSRKKNLPVIIAIAVVLLGAIGFSVWKLMHREPKYSLEADNAMFQNCKTGTDYRAYMKKYPEHVGANYELAKNRLEEWVRDSINRTQGLTPADTDQPITEVKDKGKDKDKNRDVDKTKEKNKGVDKDNGIDNDKGAGEGKKPTEDDWNKQEQNQEGLHDKPNGNENLTTSNSGMTPASYNSSEGNSGLSPAQGGGSGLTGAGGTPEEQAYNEVVRLISNNSVTIEDCKKYLRKYGSNENKQHWEDVAGKFKVLYLKQIHKCETVEEINQILNNHDALMKELHINGWTEYDTNTKKLLKTKRSKWKMNAPSQELKMHQIVH